MHIDVVTSSEAGLLSNSYVIAGRDRVIVIDPPMLLSDARTLAARVEGLGKPLGAIVITHAHPDHANGAVVLPRVPIVALAATARVLRETAEPKRAQWTPVFGADYPQTVRLPDTELADGDTFEFDEFRFEVRDLGEGECASMALWTLVAPERATFAGDFIYPGVHGWLAEGRTEKWLGQLDALERLVVSDELLYPGHGAVVKSDAIAEQRRYLEAFRTCVADVARGAGELDAAHVAEIDGRLRAQYPAHALPALIALGATGVARELASAANH